MEDRALGFAAPAHAELAEPASRLPLQGRRSRRVSHDARDDRVPGALCAGDLRPGADENDGDSRAAHRRGLHRHDRPRRMAQPGAGAGERRVQHPQRARFRAGASARDRGAHADAVPQPGPARAGWRARGRCLGHGRAARRRDPALRARGHARRGRAHPHAAALSRPRHPLVDGYRGRAGPGLPGGGRPQPRAQRAVAAARRLSRLPRRRPERAHYARRQAGRAPRRNPRRRGAVFGRVRQPGGAFRPQDEPAARPDRRLGGAQRSPGRGVEPAQRLRANPRAGDAAAYPRPQARRDPQR